ncbi:tetratricopeptide repeat protein [Propylenella binzhouense]|uniref:Tetratricopeptide repeat protein n=1 Tax=Propylenella binzhouense TaxID=2555902 RepID=A0A964T4M9_9HYPH|nr:tetratricopeptide repeat protein [Propylenella binzhouense]MYZ48431.1 tetratricopeptide repeat protein [Propylenella binzhouense]
MAHDDRSSDQFIREVDEELRRDQIKAIWDRFGVLIIGVCVAVVLVTAGYRGWLWWQQRQATAAGDRFMAALQAADSGKRDEAERLLSGLAADGYGGYDFLARLALAGEKAKAGETADAVADYDGIAGDGNVPGDLRDLARLRAALLELGAGDLDKARARAEPLAVAGNPWRHLAREVMGMVAYQQGQLKPARDLFETIQQDVEAPQDLQNRAGVMIGLIDGQLPPSETNQAAGGASQANGADQPAADASAPQEAAPAE